MQTKMKAYLLGHEDKNQLDKNSVQVGRKWASRVDIMSQRKSTLYFREGAH